MIDTFGGALLKRLDKIELNFCLSLNKVCDLRTAQSFFAAISRLGDGILWYGVILILPVLYGHEAVEVSLRMAFAGLIGLLIYKLLKTKTARERPFTAHRAIRRGARALDEHSFPSGHTLHAVSFTLVAVWYHDELGWLLIPFAVLVALSRVVLGLHYPSDVLIGAAIGWLVALLSLSL